MSGKTRLISLAGVSGFTILAATLWPGDRARACNFVSSQNAVIVTHVEVACYPDEIHAPFATSYSDLSSGIVIYDGNGADSVVMFGDTILNSSKQSTPNPVGDILDFATGAVNLLGGNDR